MTSNNFLNYEEGYGKTFHIPRTLVWDWQVVSVGWRIWAGKIRSMAEYNGLCIPVRPPRTQVHITTWLLLVRLLFSWSVVPKSLRPHGLQHARPSCPSLSPGVCASSCPLSQWCHPTISSSVTPFSSCPQSFPASVSFLMSQPFASGKQSTGASASASVLPINIQDWFPLEWTDWISLQSKGLSRVFSNTTVQKHLFFSAQLSL